MINLENEIGVLNSYSLNKKAIEQINANIKYYSVGRVKTNEQHSNGFKDYELTYNVDTDTITEFQKYEIDIEGKVLNISKMDSDDNAEYTLRFANLSTRTLNTTFIELEIFDYDEKDLRKQIHFNNVYKTVQQFRNLLTVVETGKESDQLDISIEYNNPLIANEYINTLLNEFDMDGIFDRQLEYKRTIEFVDSRSVLNNELLN